ncbi:Uncharacterised protein [Legionella pneumophila]|nr:Uncharacterised protein [Legionella pneumophila]
MLTFALDYKKHVQNVLYRQRPDLEAVERHLLNPPDRCMEDGLSMQFLVPLSVFLRSEDNMFHL